MRPASKVANARYRAEFLNAIDACLISRPANRPQSVAQLRPLLLGGGLQRRASSPATRTIETFKSRSVGWPVAAAAAAVLLVGAYGSWVIGRRQTEEVETKHKAEAKQQADAAAVALPGAQVRRQQDDRTAAENRAAEERARRSQIVRDPEAPYAEYFKDFSPAPTQPQAPSPAATGGASPRLGNGWIGIKMQSLMEGLADSFSNGQRAGALVAAVTPDSPAQRAGLREADVILRFDGKDIKALPDLLPAIRNATVGKTIDIDVWRDGKRITLRATVGRSGGDEPAPSRRTRRRG
jgi:C-terminal processing protease CtpA/Prc